MSEARRRKKTDSDAAIVPQSLEAEQSCLGAMLMQGEPDIKRDIVTAAMCMVGPDQFYREHHKHIYRAVIALYTEAEPVDAVTVSNQLREQGLLEECGGGEYLLSLIEACPSSDIKSVEHYARIVLDRHDDRARLAALEEALRLARGEEGTASASSDLMQRLGEIERHSQMARMGTKTKGVMSASDLLRQQLPQTRTVVAGLLPVGLTILAGNPKIGKSWMSFGAAIGVSTGGDFLGRATEKGEALYLALEDTPRRLQDRLRHLCRGPQDGLSNLHLVTEWPRLDEGGGEKLDAWLASHPDCKLVIIDTLQKIRPAVRGGGGDFYGEDYLAVGELKRIADLRGIAILLIHHTRKGSGMVVGGDALEEVAGTMGITGAADGIMVLRRTRGGGEATLFVTGRDVDEQELAVQWDGATGLWSSIGEAGGVSMSSARRVIFQTLWEFHHSGQPTATPNDIAGALGRSDTNSIRQNLHQMVKDGQVRRLDRGDYALLEEDKVKAQGMSYEAYLQTQKSQNNANNANKAPNDGFIKPNSQSNVSDVSAVNSVDEGDSDTFLNRVATSCGLTRSQAAFVREDFYARYGRLELSVVAFRLHHQKLHGDGLIPPPQEGEDPP